MKTRMWKLWNRYDHMYRVEMFSRPDRAAKYRAISLKLNRYFNSL